MKQVVSIQSSPQPKLCPFNSARQNIQLLRHKRVPSPQTHGAMFGHCWETLLKSFFSQTPSKFTKKLHTLSIYLPTHATKVLLTNMHGAQLAHRVQQPIRVLHDVIPKRVTCSYETTRGLPVPLIITCSLNLLFFS